MGTTNQAGQDITELESEHQRVHLVGAHPSYGLAPAVRHTSGPDRPQAVDHTTAARRVRDAAARGT